MIRRVLHSLQILFFLTVTLVWNVSPVHSETPPSATETPALNQFSNMVGIPAGRFKMGLTFKQVGQVLEKCQKVDKSCLRWWFKDEFPDHYVRVNAYWIDVYEVTNEDYYQFVQATGHRPALDETCETDSCRNGNLWTEKGYPKEVARQPVTQVSWFDAQAYCQWRGKRLPTEAEWEKAARGPAGNMYPWGNDAPPGRATYRRKWRGTSTMTDVGSYPTGASIYGVHDMAGNVWEWVSDWYEFGYYQKKEARKNPKGPKTGEFKVVRGGSWVNYADTLHSAFRRWSRPEVRFNDTGFRCAKDPLPVKETKTK